MGGPRGDQRRRVLWAIALGLTLVAVSVSAVLALFRAVQPFLPTAPSSPSSSPSDPATAPPDLPASPSADPDATADLHLPGAGTDVVYVQAAAAMYRLDLARGVAVQTFTPELTQFSSLVARPGWVLSKTVDNDTGILIRDGQPAEPLPSGLHRTGRVYPAGPDRLWLLPEDATGDSRTAVQVDLDGKRIGSDTVVVPDEFGLPNSDEADHLLITNAGGAYQTDPDGLHRLGTGQLLAIGTHHVLTWNCDARARCNTYRTDRATGQKAVLPVNHRAVIDLYQGNESFASTSEGVLSPDGTHAALSTPPHGNNDSPLVVLDLHTGRYERLPGSMTGINANAQVAWTSNSRWLLALTDTQLRAYDTTTHTVRTLKTGGEPLQHLVSADAAGF